MRAVRSVLLVGLVLAIAGTAWAQEGKKGRRGEGRGPGGPAGVQMLDFMLRGIELTDAEKANIEKVKKELEPQFKALQEKRDGVLTPEQKKAREEAVKGKEGREAFQAARDAVKLTEEQTKKLEEIRAEQGKLFQTAREKIMGALTDEHKEALKKRFSEGRPGGKRGGNQEKKN